MSAATFEPDSLDEREREALEVLLRRLADDEFVVAERYTEWQVRAPTLESDLALSNIAQDELGHARLWYDLLMDLGYEQKDLLYERDPADFRHSTLVEMPFEEGDWADAILRSYLYDVAEELRLEALEDSAHPKIADRVGKIQSEEEYHLEHATNWMERLADGEQGHQRLQDALDRLFAHALTLFEPVDPEIEETIVALGLRTRSLDELGEEWLTTVVPFLQELGLEVPVDELVQFDDYQYEVTDEQLPEVRGRDGSHTDAWFDLHEEFTQTYRDLDRDHTSTIMEKPE